MHTQPSATFSVLLRHYRERAGLTQEALAGKAGLTPNAISALERGQRRHPYPQTVQALCSALNLDAAQHDILLRLARTRADGLPPKPPAELPGILETIAASRTRRQPGVLPTAPNALVGRADEYTATVEALLSPTCRLLTVVGPGGAGKTRLALQVATDLRSRFADGAVWLPLAPVATPELVPVALADALQCPLHGAESATAQVIDFLRARDILLVLDNFEHLLPAAELLAAILEDAPQVRLLVTSRERLRLSGEWVVELGGLDLAVADAPDALAVSPASQLFAERARQVARTFALTAANRAAVTRICRLVDGMPLGIELAAAWIGTLTPADIADEIARNLDFLQLADRNAPTRHRSLRAVFDHSWNLLSTDERSVLARLAVFRGGCDRVAAAEIAGASLPQLAALIDKSLIRRSPESSGTRRYDLHELLRQYALTRLEEASEAERQTRERHCAYYARQLGDRTVAFLNGTAPVAMEEVAPDLDNIRQAWAWAVDHRDYQALALMAPSLEVICEVRGLFQEGVALFQDAVAALRAALSEEPAASSEINWTLGHLLSLSGNRAARCGQFTAARDLLHEAHALLQQRGDLLLGSGTLAWLGYMTFVLGAYGEARTWLTECIALSRAHGHTFFLARSESMLALVAQAQGAQAEALTLARAGVEDWRANGHPCSLAMALGVHSHILLNHQLVDAAETAAREGLHLAVWLQDPWSTGAALLQLGRIALAQQCLADARQLVAESLATFNAIGDPWSRGRGLVACGWVDAALGDAVAARQHFTDALTIARATQLEPIALDARFGLASLAQEEPAATLTTLAEIIAHPATDDTTRTRAAALQATLRGELLARAGNSAPGGSGGQLVETCDVLTPREVEVLRLLREGRSNQAMAAELIVAVGTVKRHVSNILEKLQAHSRLEAVARGRELGLV